MLTIVYIIKWRIPVVLSWLPNNTRHTVNNNPHEFHILQHNLKYGLFNVFLYVVDVLWNIQFAALRLLLGFFVCFYINKGHKELYVLNLSSCYTETIILERRCHFIKVSHLGLITHHWYNKYTYEYCLNTTIDSWV